MNEAASGPAGLVVLHLWTESGDRMRVRITRTIDPASGEHTTSYASTKAEVLEQVEGWLDALMSPR